MTGKGTPLFFRVMIKTPKLRFSTSNIDVTVYTALCVEICFTEGHLEHVTLLIIYDLYCTEAMFNTSWISHIGVNLKLLREMFNYAKSVASRVWA